MKRMYGDGDGIWVGGSRRFGGSRGRGEVMGTVEMREWTWRRPWSGGGLAWGWGGRQRGGGEVGAAAVASTGWRRRPTWGGEGGRRWWCRCEVEVEGGSGVVEEGR